MICYRDTTFCASPNCTNECGRKLTDEITREADRVGLPIGIAFFCGEPEVSEKSHTMRNGEFNTIKEKQ